jgi:hypothetical protein
MSDTLQEQHAAADHAMRHWTFESQGPVKIGSDAHKRMFCRMLLDTHNPYKPAVIDWPPLKPDALKRLTSLPIWDIAVQTEGRASVRVATFAATVDDPLLRSALDMDGGEKRATRSCCRSWWPHTASSLRPNRRIRRRRTRSGRGW